MAVGCDAAPVVAESAGSTRPSASGGGGTCGEEGWADPSAGMSTSGAADGDAGGVAALGAGSGWCGVRLRWNHPRPPPCAMPITPISQPRSGDETPACPRRRSSLTATAVCSITLRRVPSNEGHGPAVLRRSMRRHDGERSPNHPMQTSNPIAHVCEVAKVRAPPDPARDNGPGPARRDRREARATLRLMLNAGMPAVAHSNRVSVSHHAAAVSRETGHGHTPRAAVLSSHDSAAPVVQGRKTPPAVLPTLRSSTTPRAKVAIAAVKVLAAMTAHVRAAHVLRDRVGASSSTSHRQAAVVVQPHTLTAPGERLHAARRFDVVRDNAGVSPPQQSRPSVSTAHRQGGARLGIAFSTQLPRTHAWPTTRSATQRLTCTHRPWAVGPLSPRFTASSPSTEPRPAARAFHVKHPGRRRCRSSATALNSNSLRGWVANDSRRNPPSYPSARCASGSR